MENPVNDNKTVHEVVEDFYASDYMYVNDYMEKAIAHFAECKIDRWEVASRLGRSILKLLNAGTPEPTIRITPSIMHSVKIPRLFGDDATIEEDFAGLSVIRDRLDADIQLLEAEQKRRAKAKYLKGLTGQLTEHFTKANSPDPTITV